MNSQVIHMKKLINIVKSCPFLKVMNSNKAGICPMKVLDNCFVFVSDSIAAIIVSTNENMLLSSNEDFGNLLISIIKLTRCRTNWENRKHLLDSRTHERCREFTSPNISFILSSSEEFRVFMELSFFSCQSDRKVRIFVYGKQDYPCAANKRRLAVK